MRKQPTKKDHSKLDRIKDTRYQVATKAELHKKPLERGMLSRSSVRWYLGQCNDNTDLAAWMGVVDRELILSANTEYRNELLEIANYLLTKYGKLSTVWNKNIAYECDYLHAYIWNTYEIPRRETVDLVQQWVDVIDPDEKLYKYGWKEKKKRCATSRSPTRRLLKRVAESLLNKYGPASNNLKFRSENWNNILKFEEYVYRNVHKGYDSNVAFEVFDEKT
jgi:hypothetical protein